MRYAAQIAAISALVLYTLGLPGFDADARDRRDGRERLRERLEEKRGADAPTSSDLKGGEAMTLAGRSVVVWGLTEDAASNASPLVIFSHGDGGCATQSSFLTQSLAEAGYIVIAPNHADARCGKRKGKTGRRNDAGESADPAFRDPESWTDEAHANRRDDVQAILDAAISDPRFPINPDQIGLVGHSLGGYTSLGLAGGWDSWRTPSIRAVVALSPVCNPFTSTTGLGGVGVPVQFQGGTRDAGVTPSVRRANGCYDQTPEPASYVEFKGAGHFAWTDGQSDHHDDITRYTIAWLDHYVRGRPAAALPARPSSVSDQRVK
jgi:predicted dienelactone hydrolase